jgi:hypothetical protein
VNYVNYTLKTPCKRCPFLASRPIPLRPGRVEEIRDSLRDGGSFPCHKTVDYDEAGDDIDNGTWNPRGAELHCAGALILMDKEGEIGQNQMLRIVMRLGMFNPDELDMDALVFESWDDMINAMEGG